ncbi:hypothetical protein Mal4_12370 [Maioricimonas rarisocia]|uniref:Uncharacterized protein n=1 Tax=Maioricimonas rarisocia TaxID=2528026 RepID=A0A517Z3B9_9PLAN|nr:hypothetical protein [Maioricimonas rarisocia]QDU36936.1 hypothetical protein Mal4_12370 [Maioricimonas rarisocia]
MKTMIHRPVPLALMLAIVLTAGSCSGEPKPAQQIQNVFREFRTAIGNRDGFAAVGLVTAKSLQLYEEYRELALHADEETLQKRPPADQLQILLLRHRFTAEQLEQTTGPQLLASVIESGFYGNSLESIQLGGIAVKDDMAHASAYIDGAPSTSRYLFWREDGDWKFDLAAMAKKSNQDLTTLASQEERTPTEQATHMYSDITGEAVSPEMWQPML